MSSNRSSPSPELTESGCELFDPGVDPPESSGSGAVNFGGRASPIGLIVPQDGAGTPTDASRTGPPGGVPRRRTWPPGLAAGNERTTVAVVDVRMSGVPA